METNTNITEIVLNNQDESNVTSETVIQNTEEGPTIITTQKTGYYIYNGHVDVINIVDSQNNILK